MTFKCLSDIIWDRSVSGYHNWIQQPYECYMNAIWCYMMLLASKIRKIWSRNLNLNSNEFFWAGEVGIRGQKLQPERKNLLSMWLTKINSPTETEWFGHWGWYFLYLQVCTMICSHISLSLSLMRIDASLSIIGCVYQHSSWPTKLVVGYTI
jgi:hypothetical protein